VENLIHLLNVIVWPVTLLLLALLFRHEFRRAAARLTTLSYKDLRAEFRHDLHEIRGELNALPQKVVSRHEKPVSDADSSTHARLRRIAEISPRAAIMEAWRDVEVATKQAADACDISVGGQIAGVKAIRALVDKGLLPATVLSPYERLRRLRSKAAHAIDCAVEPEQAEEFIEMAQRLYALLLEVLQKANEVLRHAQ